jgi:hypothetical protein
MSTCLGIVKSTGLPCTHKAKDINGFCHKHISQSILYNREHPWSVIADRSGSTTRYVKIDGIVPGAFMTSESFGR